MKVIAIQYNIRDNNVCLRKYGSDNSILDSLDLTKEQVESLEEAIGISLENATINLMFNANEVIEFLEDLGGHADIVEWVKR